MSIASWLVSEITIASATGINAYGKLTYGAQRTVKARVEQAVRALRTAKGDEVQSSHRLWCLESVNASDRIWLPGADTANIDAARLPMAVTSIPDKTGARTLYEVSL